MEIYGCVDCAELVFPPENGAELVGDGVEEGEQLMCSHCGGKLLTTQQAFDKILELKSLVRQLNQDQEWDE